MYTFHSFNYYLIEVDSVFLKLWLIIHFWNLYLEFFGFIFYFGVFKMNKRRKRGVKHLWQMSWPQCVCVWKFWNLFFASNIKVFDNHKYRLLIRTILILNVCCIIVISCKILLIIRLQYSFEYLNGIIILRTIYFGALLLKYYVW